MSNKKVKRTKKRSKNKVKNTNDFYTKDEFERAVKFYEERRKNQEHSTTSNDKA